MRSSKLLGLRPIAWVELFVAVNLAFLAVDIWLAHSVNDFSEVGQWLPVGFSVLAPIFLVLAWSLQGRLDPSTASGERQRSGVWIGGVVGAFSIALGVVGLVLHLESTFFVERTLESLVYTAPFVAPLSYSGLGLLLLLNRTTDPSSSEWGRWLVLLAAGGLFGNFVLSLADHAQNGFYRWEEWVSVIASAFAFSFTLACALPETGRRLLVATAGVLGLEAGVGLWGAALHVLADLRDPTADRAGLWEAIIYGAPPFAPLLFVDLAILAGLGLWALHATSSMGLAEPAATTETSA